MAVDSTFEFERRRNAPQPYDRDLMSKTLAAMERVQTIKTAREKRFYTARMRGKGAKEKAEALRDLKTGIDVIISPLAVKASEQLQQTIAVDESEKTATKTPSTNAVKKKKNTKKKAKETAMED